MKPVILITGGFGYLGGRLAQYLATETDSELRIATRHPRPTRPDWLSRGEQITLDLEDPDSLTAACRGVQTLFHLAAVNEIDCVRDPVRAWQVNAVGTVRLLRAAAAAGVTTILYVSTAHVYGAPLAGTITEDTLPVPVHPYAMTHRAAEDAVLACRGGKDPHGMVVRLSNGFGVPAEPAVDRWTLLVNDLCRQATTTHLLRLNSSGIPLRDFIPLSDAVRAFHHLVTLPAGADFPRLYNVGGGKAVSVFSMAERIAARCAAVLGFTPPILRPDPTPGETARPLDYRIDRLLASGFQPHGDIDGEIDATLRFCAATFPTPPQS